MSMQCVHCGLKIPEIAKVCPHCHRSTEESREINGIMGGFLLLGAIIGYAILGVAGLIVGGFLGGLLSLPFVLAKHAAVKKKPAEVTIIGKTDNSSPNKDGTILEARLKRLLELKNQGLLSEAEYAKKRNEIVDKL